MLHNKLSEGSVIEVASALQIVVFGQIKYGVRACTVDEEGD